MNNVFNYKAFGWWTQTRYLHIYTCIHMHVCIYLVNSEPTAWNQSSNIQPKTQRYEKHVFYNVTR